MEYIFNNDYENEKDLIFKQYRLYVEMADHLSSRRATANGFFLTFISILLAAIGIIIQIELYLFLIPCAITGIIIAVFWFTLINRYREYNKAKFKVINKIEEKLPVKGFTTEWELVNLRKKGFISLHLTDVEKYVPLLLVGVFTLILIVALLDLWITI
ncbi:MAG: hypothetical protein ACFE9L_00940 [Candidatus Hodarchaeota archaeon]